jgi:sugar-specific transcriptional regulator TrmB
MDEISRKTGLPIYKTNPILTVLEIKGYIAMKPGKHYVIAEGSDLKVEDDNV